MTYKHPASKYTEGRVMEGEKLRRIQADLMHQSTEAVGRFLDSRAISILAFKDDKLHDAGSGTCIQIGGRYFIATASHVISPWTVEQIRIVHTVEPIPSDDWIPIKYKGVRGGELDDAIDIGWLELDVASATQIHKDFVLLEQIQCGIHHIPDDLVLVRGSPTQLLDNKWKERRFLAVQPMVLHTGTLPPSDWPESYSSQYDMVLSYPTDGLYTDGTYCPIPDAPGLSGGGIWATNVNDISSVWSPHKARLIGIQRSWRKDDRLLRGTQIQHWLRMLKEDCPELAAMIGQFLESQQ